MEDGTGRAKFRLHPFFQWFVAFAACIADSAGAEVIRMRSSRLKLAAVVLGQFVALALVSPASWAVFDDPKKAEAQADAPAATPEAQAALDAGLAAVKEADAANSGAAGGKKLSPAAKKAYTKARAKFDEATKADPKLAQAWNGLGYSNRKLGDYKTALAAYDKAIELRMGYPEATEYRGEAYLALNRTDDAKQAYLDLFSTNRELAGKLLESMKAWITSPGKKKDDVEDLSEFVQERAKIASQTASLTRESVTQGWT
jgi:tetratricopeptide (TPR) repeat protein